MLEMVDAHHRMLIFLATGLVLRGPAGRVVDLIVRCEGERASSARQLCKLMKVAERVGLYDAARAT